MTSDTPNPPNTKVERRRTGDKKFSKRFTLRVLMELLVITLGVATALTAKEFADNQGWSNGDVAAEFFTSPGFAGCLAVVAATIGFVAVNRQLNHNRLELAHEQQVEANKTWWATFQWVADKCLTNNGGDMPPTIAAAMLMDLSKNEPQATPSSPDLQALRESRTRACTALALALGSKIDPSTPQGQEVLDSLIKLTGSANESPVSPELHRMLGILQTEQGMFTKLRLICDSQGMGVITDPIEMSQHIDAPGDHRPRRSGYALVMKGGKRAWVYPMAVTPNPDFRRQQIRGFLKDDVPQLRNFAEYPCLLVLSAPITPELLNRVNVPDYVRVASASDTGTQHMKESLIELVG